MRAYSLGIAVRGYSCGVGSAPPPMDENLTAPPPYPTAFPLDTLPALIARPWRSLLYLVMRILTYQGLDRHRLQKTRTRIRAAIAREDFRAAGIRKLAPTPYWRAKPQHKSRLPV